VAATANIARGKVTFEVRNAGKLPVVFGILQLPMATFQRPKLRFTPSLYGKRLLMTQPFRDLTSASTRQVIRPHPRADPMLLQSTITCRHCALAKTETMPIDAC
jgi:hypothetical protein